MASVGANSASLLISVATAVTAASGCVVACDGNSTESGADAGIDSNDDSHGVSDATSDGTVEPACQNRACGEFCELCETPAALCSGAGTAPHSLICDNLGKCRYISSTNTPPVCTGPIECGDASCAAGSNCHCPDVPDRRCCSTGTECEPCTPQ